MHWYQGGIAEAVSLSKKTGAVFVVYVEGMYIIIFVTLICSLSLKNYYLGKDNTSKELTQLIDNERVSQQLEKEHFVAIKIEENSVPHQQFSQICILLLCR